MSRTHTAGVQGNGVLRAARIAKGWRSGEAAAREVSAAGRAALDDPGFEVSPRTWRRWESARPGWPRGDYAMALHAAFGRWPEDLGFEPPAGWQGPAGDRLPGGDARAASFDPPEEHDDHRDDEQEDDPMKRRLVLSGALAAGIFVPAGPALAAARRDIEAALGGQAPADLPFWESTAERQGRGYQGRAPAGVLAGLLADLAELSPQLSGARAGRERLAAVAGRLSGLTAIVLHDMGHERESTRWFRTAGRAAGESGDAGLHAWVLAREAMVPLNFGAPAVAASLADRARALSGGAPCAAHALACAVAARAHAACGDRGRALAAVAAADRALGRLVGGERADTWFGYPEQKHHVHLSQAFTLLGETTRAFAEQERALALTGRPSVMTRALLALDRAACLARAGERAEAASVAGDAFAGLPPAYRDGLTRTRALTVYRSVHGAPGADCLREALGGVARG
ncbi:hypothetical protein RM780_23840 [Streptomyces sp. DSM 44917]|uniref:Transcriptional regulator n=1 Tax=Streptomyces boetiae TaxID=3075541 RepID=A0ABU2LED6_9ACTN|nr:hypothetical protein [Streptomyces sp. DSM 44917]MDT0309962.1 hypothetical protein [Streptomyces sp. DSM 44917]